MSALARNFSQHPSILLLLSFILCVCLSYFFFLHFLENSYKVILAVSLTVKKDYLDLGLLKKSG